MDEAAEDDDLALAKVSKDLLSDLDYQLDPLIYKQSVSSEGPRSLHTLVRIRHLDSVIKSIEPFQSDPQMLDPKLKYLVPLIANAYLQALSLDLTAKQKEGTVDLIRALSLILYTLCKVRGAKVISGLLNNEPRYLSLILFRLERSVSSDDSWQVRYVLLLWLAHLLLTPFDLTSVADDLPLGEEHLTDSAAFQEDVPVAIQRIARVCLAFLPQPAATQQVAAQALARLTLRPDLQHSSSAQTLVRSSIRCIEESQTSSAAISYAVLGSMRHLSLVAKSSNLPDALPAIYKTYSVYMAEQSEPTQQPDAVGRSLVIKTIRNIVTTSVRSAGTQSVLEAFIHEHAVIESAIGFFIQSLSDRETLVRQNAAKALGVLLVELGADMGAEILAAVLSTLQEELPASTDADTPPTADPHTCHGCTLAIAFAMFRRSVPVGMLGQMTRSLLAALMFSQRTATGSVSGTNIRDAANFGLWSLARRYKTDELEANDLGLAYPQSGHHNVKIVPFVAVRLLQSACCDPVGNIRRGSSAALQELVGRHPDCVQDGIALVQIVDYQAVGLRRRGMIDVASQVMQTNRLYWQPIMHCLLEWRGLGSVDIASRDAAATAITQQALLVDERTRNEFLTDLLRRLSIAGKEDVDLRHGLILTLASLVAAMNGSKATTSNPRSSTFTVQELWPVESLRLDMALSPRAIKAEVPVAIARLAAALCRMHQLYLQTTVADTLELPALDTFFERLITRSEGRILATITELLTSMYATSIAVADATPYTIEQLSTRVRKDYTKSTVQGAGRVCALASFVCIVKDRALLDSALQSVLDTCLSAHIDWRVVGLKALEVVLDSSAARAAVIAAGFSKLRKVLVQSLQDYTVDERGDIGSLVRLQAIARTETIFMHADLVTPTTELQPLSSAILRLSLERLTRVRLEAAICRSRLPDPKLLIEGVLEVDSVDYFDNALQMLWDPDTATWASQAVLSGLISAAGSGSEHVLQNVRVVIANRLQACSVIHLRSLMASYVVLLRDTINASANLQPALELLGFFLQMHLLDPLQDTDFKFRTLLSIVQKSHYKSTDVQRLLSAVAVYTGLARFSSVREEVLKKLLSMLKTSPYPKIRSAVGDALFLLTHDEDMKRRDWSKPAAHNASTWNLLQKRVLPA